MSSFEQEIRIYADLNNIENVKIDNHELFKFLIEDYEMTDEKLLTEAKKNSIRIY